MVIGKSLKEPSKPASLQTPKCQKCLESGHWTYECKGKRKFLNRSSRSSLLNKRMKALEDKEKDIPPSGKQKRIVKNRESYSSSSSSTSSSSSSESSSDSSSDSGSDSSSSSDSNGDSE
uniref:Putative zinc finger cchc domain-containing protein 10 n=1 Tax=Triatoma infestans TaxID=30076 RepID=A0A023F769_TRIIF